MNRAEIRYRLTAALLQAGEPMAVEELCERAGVSKRSLRPVLKEMIDDEQVLEGELVPDKGLPQYCWAARWRKHVEQKAAGAKRRLQRAVDSAKPRGDEPLDIESDSARAFHDFIINDYSPPRGKRFLVFLQCSVRRPFSSSPSHGTMKQAITIATGYDPASEFEQCPAHVVVMASFVGPVPYELQDVYPANVRAGGVKDMPAEMYARYRPILASRMAEYITAHGGKYKKMASFTQSRYGDVMRAAQQIAGVEFPVFPQKDGPRVLKGRKYWDKFWIQLYLEIVRWLTPAERKKAAARLMEAGVQYE